MIFGGSRYAVEGGNPAEQYRLDFYIKREDGNSTPEWQDLTANDSSLHASARFMRDPRYWEPGHDVFQPDLHRMQSVSSESKASKNAFAKARLESDNKLSRITIRLPPPPPHAASRLPLAVRSAFRRLFSALNLEDIFADDVDASIDRNGV